MGDVPTAPHGDGSEPTSGVPPGPDATRAAAPIHPPSAEPPGAPVPARLGRYTILRVLGEGGMGTVYEAQQDNPRRTVALKVIRAGSLSDELLRRFGQESQVLARLQHPGIAQVYEAGTAHEQHGAHPRPLPFFAMEFVRGVPLTEYADSHHLGTRDRLELIAKVCDAVYHAHQKGVIHRDLKPANILVDQSGQPKILDFGVARATDSDIQQTTMQTSVGQLIGTVRYMSPEQIGGDPFELDTRSDVYALGVIAYELLTGRLPHNLRNTMLHEAARIIREQEPPRLSSINRALRGDAETIAAKALEKDKTRRYQSAEALASDIRRYLRHEPIAARPASAWYQARKFSRRHRGLVAGLAAALLCLIAGLVLTLISRAQAVRARDDAEGFVTLLVDKVRDKFDEVGRLDALAAVAGSVGDYYARRGESSLDAEQLLRFAKSLQLAGEAALGSKDLTAARRAFIEQQRMLAALVARQPPEGRSIKALGAAHYYLGLAAYRAADLDEAQRQWHAYLAIAQRLVALDADNPEWQLELAYAHSNFVTLHQARARPAEALASLDLTLQIKRRLVAMDPANTEYRRGLSNSLTQLADARELASDLGAAQSAAAEALEVMLAVVAQEPSNTNNHYRLAVNHVHVGELHFKTGRHAEALAAFRAAQDAARRLIEIDPSNGDWQREMAVGHRLAARAAMAAGDPASAALDLAASRRLLEALVARDPANLRWRHDLVSTERESSRLAESQAQWGPARQALARARAILQSAPIPADDNPTRSDNTIRVAFLDITDGRLLHASGDPDAARGLWSGAVAMLEPAAAKGEHDVLDSLAHALLLLGRHADAAPHIARLRAAGGQPSPEVEALLKAAGKK